MRDKAGLLFRERVVEILMTIYSDSKDRDVYIQYLANKVGCPHSYAWLVVKKLEEAGIVESFVDGRNKILRLTKKGEEICKSIENILRIL